MIPEELKKYNHWVCWKFMTVNGRRTKMPINPLTGNRAMANNPRTWSSYKDAVEMSKYYDGVGFVFSRNDPFIGIDIDHCINENGKMAEYAEKIMKECGSYAELSPSGTGVHIIGKGSMVEGMTGRRTTLIEMYETNRFFTVTGQQMGHFNDVKDIQPTVNRICEEYFTKTPVRKEMDKGTWDKMMGFEQSAFNTDDKSFLENVLFKQKNGAVLKQMYEGENPLFGGDASRNDLYFCNQCNWANGNNIEQTDRIMRSSGRMREKWDRKHWANGHTYGQETLKKAISPTPKRGVRRYQGRGGKEL